MVPIALSSSMGGRNFVELGIRFVHDVADLLADVLDVDVPSVGSH